MAGCPIILIKQGNNATSNVALGRQTDSMLHRGLLPTPLGKLWPQRPPRLAAFFMPKRQLLTRLRERQEKLAKDRR